MSKRLFANSAASASAASASSASVFLGGGGSSDVTIPRFCFRGDRENLLSRSSLFALRAFSSLSFSTV